MTRLNTCSEPDCGHYKTAHTQPGVSGGCLVVVHDKRFPRLGAMCCSCIQQYPEGLSKEDVEKQRSSGYFSGLTIDKMEEVVSKPSKEKRS